MSAVLSGRFILHLDTNYYFGVAGLNTFPFNLFFVPYYGLAIVAFFSHIAAVHHKKMNYNIFGLTPIVQSKAIIIAGFFLTLVIFYGLTNHFHGVKIPAAYNISLENKCFLLYYHIQEAYYFCVVKKYFLALQIKI